MRYPAAEKLEIIRLVEQSLLSVRHTPPQVRSPSGRNWPIGIPGCLLRRRRKLKHGF